MNTPKYSEKTVQKFLDYLNKIGLSVYGNHMVNGVDYGGCMDYESDQIILRRKLIEKGKLISSRDLHGEDQ